MTTTLPEIKFNVPEEILTAIAAHREGVYSDLLHVFHCVWLGDGKWVGVAGDGDNAAYEWFVVKKGAFDRSNVGYGDTAIALRDVLNREVR